MTGPRRGPDLVELARRASEAARADRPGALVCDVTPMAGGQSSLTFAATLVTDDIQCPIVLKVAPAGLEPVRNRDVLRQARILRALAPVSGMKVPTVLFEDRGSPPVVPPMFAMARVPGRSFEPHLDEEADADSAGSTEAAEVITTRALGAARLLALLHRQQVAELGLADEPTTTLSTELDRWERALMTVTEIIPEPAPLVSALRATMPADEPPRVVHGDFRLGNVLARGPRIEAIVDWEIWSVGDPRSDLAWFLLCGDAHWHPTARRDHRGMPAATDLIREYRAGGGPATMTASGWFRALALLKMAAATALIAKYQLRSGDDEAARATAAPTALMMARAAHAVEASDSLGIADCTAGPVCEGAPLGGSA